MSKIDFSSKIDAASAKLTKFTQLRYVKVITNGFMSIAALSIAGSIFTLFKSLPIAPYQTFLTNSGIGNLLSIPVSVTSDFIAVFVVLAMGYEVARSFDMKPFAPAIIALGSFMILTPFSGQAQVVTDSGETIIANALNVIPLTSLGARGIFLAILTGITASRLYIALVKKGIVIKMPASVPPAVGQMFETMIPGGVTFILYLVVRYAVSLTSFATMQNLIYTIIQTPLMGATANMAGMLVYCIASKVLWLFGIHGGLVTYAAFGTIIKTTGAANVSAFAAGETVHYLEWGMVTGFTNVGMLGLSLAMIICTRSKQYKSLGKLSLPTSLFNISEPLIFGFPLVMNPVMAIPFILSPIVSILPTVVIMQLGLVAPITGAQVATTIPFPIWLSLMNSSVSGFIWGLVVVALNVLLYLPFVKIADRMACSEETASEATGAQS